MLEARFGQLSIDEGHLEIEAASCNITTLDVLRKRCSITEPSPSMLMGAAKHGSLAVMKHLLALGNATITKEMLIAAAWNSECTTDMLKLLWPLARHIEVYPEMFLGRDFQNIEPTADIGFLVSKVQDADIYQEVLNQVILKDSSHDSIVVALLELGFGMDMDYDVLMSALDTCPGQAVLVTFLEHGVDIKLANQTVDKVLMLRADSRSLRILVQHRIDLGLDIEYAKYLLIRLDSRQL